MRRNILNFQDAFYSALLMSVAVHTGIWGISSILPSPVQYPVQQAPNAIDVILVEEILSQEEIVIKEPLVEKIIPEPVEEIVEQKPEESAEDIVAAEESDEEVVVPVEEKPLEQPVPVQESQQSLGAIIEAEPLDFVNPAPQYPSLARRRGWEGRVIIQVTVEKDGYPSFVAVVESSGYRLLDEEALRTIRQWRFKPARSGPLTFASTINIPVRFQLVEKSR